MKDTVAILTSTGRLLFLCYKTLEVEDAESFSPISFLLPSPPKSIVVLEEHRSEPDFSLLSLFNGSGGDQHVTVHEKLVQVLQTSPEVLFRQKISGGEFGEAILLANKFGLNADEVYKAQWACNNTHPSAIQVHDGVHILHFTVYISRMNNRKRFDDLHYIVQPVHHVYRVGC